VLRHFLEHGERSEARMNPIAVEDVVAALVAADTRDAELRGTWELGGPEVITPGELARRIGGRWRAFPPRIAPNLVDLLERDQIADPSEAVRQFGLALSPVP
ncbi:MAG: hypothetical protein ACRDKG_13060, partial [Actinomycetota bacterium]